MKNKIGCRVTYIRNNIQVYSSCVITNGVEEFYHHSRIRISDFEFNMKLRAHKINLDYHNFTGKSIWKNGKN